MRGALQYSSVNESKSTSPRAHIEDAPVLRDQPLNTTVTRRSTAPPVSWHGQERVYRMDGDDLEPGMKSCLAAIGRDLNALRHDYDDGRFPLVCDLADLPSHRRPIRLLSLTIQDRLVQMPAQVPGGSATQEIDSRTRSIEARWR
jgi:hypothetical protein